MSPTALKFRSFNEFVHKKNIDNLRDSRTSQVMAARDLSLSPRRVGDFPDRKHNVLDDPIDDPDEDLDDLADALGEELERAAPAARDRSRSRSPRRGDRAAPDGDDGDDGDDDDKSEEDKPKPRRKQRQDATHAKVVVVGDFYGNIDVPELFFSHM